MKRMTWFLIAALALSGAIFADVFSIDNLSLGTAKLRTTEKSSGKVLWNSTLKIQRFSDSGQDYLYTEENGSGIYGPDKKNQTWRSQSYFLFSGDQLVPYSVNLVFKNPKGEIVKKIKKFYNAKTNRVECQVNDKTSDYDFKAGIADKEDLSTNLQNYPFGVKKSAESYLLTHEPTLYRITIKDLGTETVTVDGQSFQCYKLEIIPDLGALNIFGAFVPKTYFWFQVAAPHDFVKYEGLESGLGTPYIVLERLN